MNGIVVDDGVTIMNDDRTVIVDNGVSSYDKESYFFGSKLAELTFYAVCYRYKVNKLLLSCSRFDDQPDIYYKDVLNMDVVIDAKVLVSSGGRFDEWDGFVIPTSDTSFIRVTDTGYFRHAVSDRKEAFKEGFNRTWSKLVREYKIKQMF